MATIRLLVQQAEIDDVFEDMVRVHKDHRPFSEAGEVIVVMVNSKTTPLVARGSKKNAKDGISLDSKARGKLGVKVGLQYDFSFQKAGWTDQMNWAYHASSPMPRIGIRLAFLSLILGGAGLFLGIVSVL